MVKVAPKPPSHLDDLNPEQVEDFNDKMTQGYTAKQILEYMIETYGVWKDKKLENIAVFISRKKKQLSKKVVAETYAKKVSTMGQSAIAKRLDSISQLEDLVAIQTTRFQKMYLKEKDGPLLLKQVSEEGKLLKDMLVDLAKLQLDTGVLRRAPKTITGALVGADGQVKEFSWTEEQQELLEVLEGAIIDHDEAQAALPPN